MENLRAYEQEKQQEQTPREITVMTALLIALDVLFNLAWITFVTTAYRRLNKQGVRVVARHRILERDQEAAYVELARGLAEIRTRLAKIEKEDRYARGYLDGIDRRRRGGGGGGLRPVS